MESENEVLVGSVPPGDCTDKREDELHNPGADDDSHLECNLPNHDGGDFMGPKDPLPKENSADTQLPHTDHKSVEMELRAAQERIEKLQTELLDAEKKLADSNKNLSAASKQAEDYEKEMKNQEEVAKKASDECARLKTALEVAEASTREVDQTIKNLENEVQTAKAQILENNEAQTHLEAAKVEKAKIEEENCLMREKVTQLEGHLADEKSRAADLEGKIQNAETELKKQEESLIAAQETTATVKEQLSTLEEMLKGTQDELKAKEDGASGLEAEVVSLKSKVSEVLSTSEENLKILEGEHEKQLKVSEERYEALQKSLLELEGKTAQLQDSLDAAGTDAETARMKVAELERELENLLQNKSNFEAGAAELQLQLKSTEETLSKHVDNLKVAEENADKANGEVVRLESVLKNTEEKLRVSEEAADSLQLQVTDLIDREAKSVERLKEVEDSFQKMQLELQSQLEGSETNFKSRVSQLEGDAAQLQESLAAAVLEGEGARKKVSDLELELDSLRHIHGELEEKVRISEEKCSQHESSAHTLRTRGVELEGLITEHQIKADDAHGKVASLEAALLDTQDKANDLEVKLKLAEDNNLQLENTFIARSSELERCNKVYEVKISELETVCAVAKSTEHENLEILHSTEEMLKERETEIRSASQKISELELSVESMEVDLKGALTREKLVTEERASLEEKIVEMEALITKLEGERGEFESRVHQHMSLVEKGKVDLHEASVQEGKLKDEISSLQAAKTELQDLLSQIENEKQTTIAQLDRTQKRFAELNEQLVQERQQLQEQIATILQENGDLAQKIASMEEKLHASLAAAELSAKQVQEGCMKESTLSAQIEDLNSELRRALDVCTHVERLEQEKKNLSEKFASTQEKLDATLGAAEVSAAQVQEAVLKESTLNAQIEDLKAQLGKAMDACLQVEKLEQTLKTCITAEEHQAQMDQVLATSNLAESKLADVEEQLSKSKLEISRFQKAFDEQETHVKEPESRTTKIVEGFDQQPSGGTKSREIELDSLSPGKVRNRKKKAVTWEAEGNAALKTRALEIRDQPLARHSASHFVAHILIAAVSLLLGFWVAKRIHL